MVRIWPCDMSHITGEKFHLLTTYVRLKMNNFLKNDNEPCTEMIWKTPYGALTQKSKNCTKRTKLLHDKNTNLLR
jgi:hypothetical protein